MLRETDHIVMECQLRMKMRILTLSLGLLFFMLPPCEMNEMDPHVYPDEGPFFEGWYMRIIDSQQNISLGFLFGRVLPTNSIPLWHMKQLCGIPTQKPITGKCRKMIQQMSTNSPHTSWNHNARRNQNSDLSPPLVYLSQLLNLDAGGRLDNPTAFFKSSEYSITQDGKPVTRNPDDETPPHFEAKVARNLSFTVSPNGTKFYIAVGDQVLCGETTRPVPWGPHGEGPESWLEYLPLPFHWFIYSMRSTVQQYSYVNLKTGQMLKGGLGMGAPVVAHMEKNWGKSFPKAWVWSEGVDPIADVSFSFSAGLVTELGLDIKAQLSGYRNPGKGIHCSFHPANSLFDFTHDGCAGTATLKVEGVDCAVTFQVSAPPKSFSRCLQAPMVVGFKKGCVESYSAVANITVYQRQGFSMVLTDTHVINMAALEFGLEYMCNSSCPPE